jgi:uncharacterized repeat protein (TIGR03803 family)
VNLSGLPAHTDAADSQAHVTGDASSNYAILHSFGNGSDGSEPSAELVYVNGTLYGTTEAGGANDKGTVFSINSTGVEHVLHSFGNGFDGAQPAAGLIDVNGTLYGTTVSGGRHGQGRGSGYGTVFTITTSGKERVLHNFDDTDGANPFAALIDANGILYGTTSGGGNTFGTVFSITPKGDFHVLHLFDDVDGEYPVSPLVAVKGALYGTTAAGGSGRHGAIFRATLNGDVKDLYSFGIDYRKGYDPRAGLTDVNGTLYGTTAQGGNHGDGIIFKINTSGKEQLLHNFTGKDGSLPYGDLTRVNNTLYGTARCGGSASGGCSLSRGAPGGTVFSVTTSGKVTVLHNFGQKTDDGAQPAAGVIDVHDTLYGTTFFGGAYGQYLSGGSAFALKL